MPPDDPPPPLTPAPEDDAVLITYDMCEVPGDSGAARADGRTDFERGMSYFPRLTLVLVVILVVVFGWQLATGALASEEAIIAAGALHRERVLVHGEFWRLLTATFLHGSIDHLIGNCLVLWIVGMACEHAVGRTRTGLIYFAAALGGSLLSLAMGPGPSVGASGAVFGLSAAVVAFLYKYQRLFYLRDKRIGFVLGLWSLWQLGIGFLTPFVDNAAHLGGLVAGAALVMLMRPRVAMRTAPVVPG
jgi:rhomboid protease GluP